MTSNHRRHDRDPADGVDVENCSSIAAKHPHLQLVASVEPSVVFTSLASRSVPGLCDGCTVDVVDNPGAAYRIVYPPQAMTTGHAPHVGGTAPGASGAAVPTRLDVYFSHPRPGQSQQPGPDGAGGEGGFRGRAVFRWHYRTPSDIDRMRATMAVNDAVQTVLWQRTEQAGCDTVADAARVRRHVLETGCIATAVGVLVTRHDVTADQAFALLRRAGRRDDRAVRDVAMDVIDTGWLHSSPGSALHRGGPRRPQHRPRSQTPAFLRCSPQDRTS